MRPLLLLLSLLAATPAFPQRPEDAAHRADRLRTQQLNRGEAAAAARRKAAQSDLADEKYRTDRARYERERAEWRRRFDACQAGDWSACR